jgi:hypothetical protein
MTINEMQVLRKQRGLLYTEILSTSKSEEIQKEPFLEGKENNSKNIQIKFIKKVNYNSK